ncbi:MAG: tetratricopeptide repeat protein [Desulfobulbus sp.]|jgi:predicted negative regulator of RcsB-dependent stress response|uniref:tetratricopeptide repeat protein n=1 Tax=Desulfobulbus sp. TaxID=895 RepID=UPI0028406A42|nr:tetratricopeptide repeat protein [Desulfobulbus sp.]MDR2550776.1 tetratricopeptide repeat protein [Desulfobulbus sp.]
MRRLSFIIFLLLLAVNQFCGSDARAEALLKAITRNDDSASLHLVFDFDQLPEYHLATSGRRIDLVLRDVAPSATLSRPETDDKMVKLVSRVETNGMLLSFYFRYPPQKVTSESRKEDGQVVIDILLGNQQSASQPDLSAPPQQADTDRKTAAQAPTGPANPVDSTAFAKNWRSFFIEYESPLTVLPAPKLHLPPFPMAAALPPQLPVTDWLSEETLAQAKENKWFQVCLLLREQVARQPTEKFKERLVLTYAEALIRAGEYQEPYFLLQRIVIQYPDTPMAEMASMLQIYQEAERGDVIDAYYELRNWMKKNEGSPLSGSYHLLLAELALLANRLDDAKKLLDNPAVANDTALAPLRQLRQADLLSAAGQMAKAVAAYQDLDGRSPGLIENQPMSLARFANELYAAGQYAEAAKRYQQLADMLTNRPQQDLVLFRLALAQLHVPATAKKARIELQQISNAFPTTEGGMLAQLKQTDVDFIANKMPANEAEAFYGRCTALAEAIAVREECGFKLALVKVLSGDNEAGVNQCMQMLRSFQSGRLRTEVTALLIQQLPLVIKQLVKDGESVKALVLAKQNKYLFANGWLDTGMLYDLALACDKLGMTDQTAEIYQYLFDVSDQAGQEKIYLPLIQSLAASDQYLQVEEYADRYLARYPEGANRPAVFVSKILALYDSGQVAKALAQLNDEANPKVLALELLKGRIYYEQQAWKKAIETLTQPEVREMLNRQGMLLPLAESYFHAGQNDQALPLFERIAERNRDGSEQAHYRLAQIALRKDRRPEALKLFKELAEKGTDPLWTKLAREEAAILELDKR